jgi:hypothetical protein
MLVGDPATEAPAAENEETEPGGKADEKPNMPVSSPEMLVVDEAMDKAPRQQAINDDATDEANNLRTLQNRAQSLINQSGAFFSGVNGSGLPFASVPTSFDPHQYLPYQPTVAPIALPPTVAPIALDQVNKELEALSSDLNSLYRHRHQASLARASLPYAHDTLPYPYTHDTLPYETFPPAYPGLESYNTSMAAVNGAGGHFGGPPSSGGVRRWAKDTYPRTLRSGDWVLALLFRVFVM